MSDLIGVNDTLPVRLGGVSSSSGLPDFYADVLSSGQLKVAVSDGSGTAITSTLVGVKQSLDVNVSALVNPTDAVGSGTITSSSGSTSIVTTNTNGSSAVTFNVTGTWSATIQIEGTVDGTNWFSINGDVDSTDTIESSFTINGFITVGCGSYSQVRLRASVFASGTVNIAWDAGLGVNLVEVFNTNAASLSTTSTQGPPGVTAWLTTDAADGPVTPGSVASKSILIGGQYNTTLPSPTNTQQVAIQSDYRGRLISAPISNSYFHPIYTLRVQSVPAVTTVLSTSLTATIAATKAGNTIIVSACCNAGTLTITDSATQSYSTATTLAGNTTQTSKIFYFPNTAAGVTTVTISSTSSTDLNMIVTEYSGTLTASPLDQTSAHGQTATTSWTSNATATTAQASELLIGSCMGTLHVNSVFVAGSGWTAVNTANNTRGGSNLELFMEDQYVTAIGTYAATGTITGNPNDDLYGSIATFKLITPNMVTPINSATLIKNGQGTLVNIIINTIGTGSANATFYDNTTASGTIIAALNLTGTVNSLAYNLHFINGLTMVVNSSTPDFTVVYD